MSRVFLSFDHLGLGIQYVEALEGAGLAVTWPREPVGVPPDSFEDMPDAVILGGESNEVRLGKYVRAWREVEPAPGILVFAPTEQVAATAASLRAITISNDDTGQALVDRVRLAIRLRYAGELSERFARFALNLGAQGQPVDRAVMILSRARDLDPFMVREALRPRIHEYVSHTQLVGELREMRALTVPEVELIQSLTGATTLATAIDSGKMDAAAAARTLWALACIGAVRLTKEPPDLTTQARRAVSRARHHLRERRRRLRRGQASYYEVLEASFEPTQAELRATVQRLAIRFSPKRLAQLDLGDMTGLVGPLWKQIERAWEMMYMPETRKQYVAYLRSKGVDVAALRERLQVDPGGAERDFLAGQQALTGGEVHKAVSLFASAARRYPGHADYEAYLAWGRYRMSVDRGEDKLEAAMRERNVAEAGQAGRQPRPRALLALGLLCAACEDLDAARWHLHEALECDPNFALARQILNRLGDG